MIDSHWPMREQVPYEVDGIPCIICITDWDPYQPAVLRADPDDSYPAEGGCGVWEILDRKGRPAPWLEAKLTGQGLADVEHKIFNYMESN